MIKKLSVKNFKSIKELEIDCRKINLFIGEPNTGKSNILEALGVLSWCAYREKSEELKEYVRFEYMDNLFYDNSTDKPITIEILEAEAVESVKTQLATLNGAFQFEVSLGDSIYGKLLLGSFGNVTKVIEPFGGEFEYTKFYKFRRKGNLGRQDGEFLEGSFLMPSHGSNIYRVVSGSKKLRAVVSPFFTDFDFKLMLRTETETFEFLKEIDDVIYNFPYVLLSDTLQRMIFYTIAMESNENSTLIFEEPESHAFPDDTHRFGKKIAFDKTNQYFIATHDPYLLLAILEKAPRDDVNVFITYVRDYQTRVKCLNDEEKSKIMVYDPFANLDKFIGDLGSFATEEE